MSKERAALQSEVERQRILMKELSEQMDGLRSSTAAERKERAKAALRVSEGIAAEWSRQAPATYAHVQNTKRSWDACGTLSDSVWKRIAMVFPFFLTNSSMFSVKSSQRVRSLGRQ